MANYTINTTPTTPAGGVALNELGIRALIPKPTTNLSLTGLGFTEVEILKCSQLADAVAAGHLTLFADDRQITSVQQDLAKTVASLEEVLIDEGEPTGVLERFDSTLSFNSGTREFTVAPTSTYFDVYLRGSRYRVSAPISVVVPNTTALYFFYLDETLALQYVVGFDIMLLREKALLATVYWNATTGQAVCFCDERHGIAMAWATHSHLHNAFGTRYYRGFGIGFTLNGDGTSEADTQIALSEGVIADEDIVTTITHSAAPSAPFEQVLSPVALLPALYKLGSGNGEWRKDAATSSPIKIVGSVPQINEFDGSAWSLQPVTAGSFFAVWVFAFPALSEPVVAVLGSREDSTLNLAKAENSFASVEFGSLPANEFKVLFRLIYEYQPSYSNSTKCVLRDVLDLRRSLDQTLVASTTNPAKSHSTLLDLTNDDHPHYFNQARGDARYYTKLQADAQYQPKSDQLSAVAGLSANGLVVRTAANTIAARTISPGSSKVAISNGDGAAGNPTVDVNEGNLSIAQSQIPGLVTDLAARELVANKSTDTNLGTSDSLYPTQRAVKVYIDNATSGLLDDRGNYDASTNLYPTTGGSGVGGAVLKGDLWFISVAGVLGGVAVEVGDMLRALADTPGQTSTNWAIAQANLGYVPENVVNKSNDASMSANSSTLYPTQQAARGYIDTQVATRVVANAAITPGTRTKVTYDAKGLVTGGADATTADILESLDRRYVTDAEKTKLSNLSGVNSGDQTIILSGDVAGTGTGPITTTIQSNAVTDGKIASHTSTKITITNKGQLNPAIVYRDQDNAYDDTNQIFRSDRLQIRNPANSASYVFQGGTIAAARTLILPTTTQTETLAIVPQVSQVTPANPTGTASTTPVMMGLAVPFTPRTGGRIKITVEGTYGAANAGSNMIVAVRYGTGAAPANGTPGSGTILGQTPTFHIATSNEFIPFTMTRYVSNLTIGTAIWIDLSLTRGGTNATVSVLTLTVTIEEQ